MSFLPRLIRGPSNVSCSSLEDEESSGLSRAGAIVELAGRFLKLSLARRPLCLKVMGAVTVVSAGLGLADADIFVSVEGTSVIEIIFLPKTSKSFGVW